MKELKMLQTKTNDYREEFTNEYLFPIKAIKLFLETDSETRAIEFVNSEYISDDTEEIVNLCYRENIPFRTIRNEIDNYYNN